MKICGACGLELDKSCFSKKQWQLSKQKRRCRECVDKRTPPGEVKATQLGTDDDDDAEPLPPVEIPAVPDGAGCAGKAEADDVGGTNIKSAKGETDNEEIRYVASAWMCTLTQSNCRAGTASVKSASTAGIRSPSMTSISPGTARCAGIRRSHREK